jgi:protein associated with RNAse G/E
VCNYCADSDQCIEEDKCEICYIKEENLFILRNEKILFLISYLHEWHMISKMVTLKKRGIMYPQKGSYTYIQSFKHDGSLHRTWCKAFVLEADEDHIVAVTDRAWVIEADNRKWVTREPAVCFLYRKKWFNVISMIRHTGVYYYCNLASPSIYDGEAIKNIDYDLDVKLYPDGGYQILDEERICTACKGNELFA